MIATFPSSPVQLTTKSVFTTYRFALQIRDRIMGGIPKNPKQIEAWLLRNLLPGQTRGEELRVQFYQVLADIGAEVTEGMVYEDLVAVAKEFASTHTADGFKVDERGPYVESRCVKALIKESTNILFAGERWLPTRKGPRSAVAERVFVNPDRIWLGVDAPTGVQLCVAHTNGPQGPRSSMRYVEFVERPVIEFELKVLNDFMSAEQWGQLFEHAQENGLGAMRSQGFGRFDVIGWEKVS